MSTTLSTEDGVSHALGLLKLSAQVYDQRMGKDVLCVEASWMLALEVTSSMPTLTGEVARKMLMDTFMDQSASFWLRLLSGCSCIRSFEPNSRYDELDDIVSCMPALPRSEESAQLIALYVITLAKLHGEYVERAVLKFMESCFAHIASVEAFGARSPSVDDGDGHHHFRHKNHFQLLILSFLYMDRNRLTQKFIDWLNKCVLQWWVPLLDSLPQVETQVRDSLVKRLLIPMLKHGDSLITEELLLHTRNTILMACGRSGAALEGLKLQPTVDLLTASTLLCFLVMEKKHIACLLASGERFWLFVQVCFLDQEMILRKRGAYIMQCVLQHSDPHNLQKNNHNLKKSWMYDFLDIYQQVEDCHALHLVKQTTEHMRHLCGLCFNSIVTAEQNVSSSLSSSHESNLIPGILLDAGGQYPIPSFHWLKALLHVILRSQMPNIRKEVMLEIVQGDIALNCEDGAVIYWIAAEFLPAVDSVAFFPSAIFFGAETDVGCDDATNRAPPKFLMGGNVYHKSPGSLVPYFLSRVLLSTRRIELRARLICSLVNAILTGRINTIATIKWVFRAFYEPSIQQLIPPNCFTTEDLKAVQALFLVRFNSTNASIKLQISQGFIPLMLLGSQAETVDLLSITAFLEGTVGLPAVFESRILLQCFVTTLNRSSPKYLDGVVQKDSAIPYLSDVMLYVMATSEKSTHGLQKLFVAAFSDLDNLSVLSDAEPTVRFLFEITSALQNVCECAFTDIIYGNCGAVLDALNGNAVRIANYLCSLLRDIFAAPIADCSFSSSFVKSVVSVLASLVRLPTITCRAVDENIYQCIVEFVRSISDSLERSGTETLFPSLLGVYALRTLLEKLMAPLTSVAFPIFFSDALFDLASVLLRKQKFTSQEYQHATASHQHKKVSKLLNDMLCEYSIFSKFTTAYIECRWGILSEVVKMWHLSHYPRGKLYSAVEGNIFDFLIDEAEGSSVFAMKSILLFTRVVACHFLPSLTDFALSEYLRQLEALLQISWDVSIHSSNNISIPSLAEFIQLIFAKNVLLHLDISTVKCYYRKIYELGLNFRGYMLQLIVLQLTTVWLETPAIGMLFISEIVDLLLYKEPPRDDNAAVNISVSSTVVVRFFVLNFLERLQSDPDASKQLASQTLTQKIIRTLIGISSQKAFATQAMVGSELFGQKLRIWQALCVLSLSVDIQLMAEIVDPFFEILFQNCAHNIRTSIEIFGARMAILYPHIMLPRIAQKLDECNHAHQNLASLFIILGYVVEKRPAFLGPSWSQRIVDKIMPWVVSAAGLPRTIAILLLNDILPNVLLHDNSSQMAFMQGILRHILCNKDSQKVIKRAKEFFKEYDVDEKCTLYGLCQLGVDNTGEILPEHLLSVMGELLRNVLLEQEVKQVAPGAVESGVCSSDTFQTKIVPFDALHLAIEEENSVRTRNARGHNRKPFIVCATLVDKAINIAGIARTCEIFNVESLVVADINVTKTEAFQGIAVSAAEWLPILEITPVNLVGYLGSMKRKGWEIIALEQTDSSTTVGDFGMHLPEKCILVLGKEREGVPIEILQICTSSIEIRQFGILRSLNVHVAASICIYELTKTR